MRRVFRYPVTLQSRPRGFTIIEVLFGALLSALLLAGLFYALNSGELSNTLSLARADLQSEVRNILERIVKDARQTVSWDISNNSPSGWHIKFRQVEGWNTTNNTLSLTSNFTEYVYDANSKTITRNSLDAAGNTLQEWSFNNIVSEPFYTLDTGGNIVPLNPADLITSRRLVVLISSLKQVRGLFNTSCTLTQEVRIRNE